jgi:hypothetical protein
MDYRFRSRIFLIFVAALLAVNACVPRSNPSEVDVPSEVPAERIAARPGDPRPPAYWAVWNTCAPENRATQAAANGGREAGWTLMDDLLVNPGILVGLLELQTCPQGLSLLQSRNLEGIEKKNDAAYPLAAQLLAAQLNLAVGSEYCPASDGAVSEAQVLLLKLNFNGMGSYLGPPILNEDVETARILEQQLADYNTGTLCVPP